jgi:hypothetical protein
MELRVQLKICEACGCLWYRTQIDTRVYCTGCHERFKDFPTPQSRKRRGRPRKANLPTVFAVQATAECVANEKLFQFHAGYGLQSVHKLPGSGTVSESSEVPLALLASDPTLSLSTTFAGGAQ